MLPGVPEPVREAIERAQPYRNYPAEPAQAMLVQLRVLANRDKHRTLATIASAVVNEAVGVATGVSITWREHGTRSTTWQRRNARLDVHRQLRSGTRRERRGADVRLRGPHRGTTTGCPEGHRPRHLPRLVRVRDRRAAVAIRVVSALVPASGGLRVGRRGEVPGGQPIVATHVDLAPRLGEALSQILSSLSVVADPDGMSPGQIARRRILPSSTSTVPFGNRPITIPAS
jgi:hypothetical protein